VPALSGQVITQITDAAGNPAITVTWFFDPATRVLRNNTVAWTAPDGTVYPAGTAAAIGDNRTNVQQKVGVVVNGVQLRWLTIPAGGARTGTATQLANLSPANGGPYTTADDLNGLTFNLA
jgi:hypothetical protein